MAQKTMLRAYLYMKAIRRKADTAAGAWLTVSHLLARFSARRRVRGMGGQWRGQRSPKNFCLSDVQILSSYRPRSR